MMKSRKLLLHAWTGKGQCLRTKGYKKSPTRIHFLGWKFHPNFDTGNQSNRQEAKSPKMKTILFLLLGLRWVLYVFLPFTWFPQSRNITQSNAIPLVQHHHTPNSVICSVHHCNVHASGSTRLEHQGDEGIKSNGFESTVRTGIYARGIVKEVVRLGRL